MGIPKREVKWGGSTYSEVWIDGLREGRVGGFSSHLISTYRLRDQDPLFHIIRDFPLPAGEMVSEAR